jgi:colicin import membrane protein
VERQAAEAEAAREEREAAREAELEREREAEEEKARAAEEEKARAAKAAIKIQARGRGIIARDKTKIPLEEMRAIRKGPLFAEFKKQQERIQELEQAIRQMQEPQRQEEAPDQEDAPAQEEEIKAGKEEGKAEVKKKITDIENYKQVSEQLRVKA